MTLEVKGWEGRHLVICAVHNLHNKKVHEMSKCGLANGWNNITKSTSDLNVLGYQFSDLFSLKIGDGNKFLFWQDAWLDGATLQDRFPFLYSIETQKKCTVRDRIGELGFSWSWSRPITESDHIFEFCNLLHAISRTLLTQNPDRLKCNISQNGLFEVHNVRRWIDDKITTPGNPNMCWVKSAPMKVNCFIWRVGMGRIPVAKNLMDRGVNIGSSRCKICDMEEETVDHALINCSKAIDIRRWIFNWCGVPFQSFSKADDLLEFAARWGNCPKKRRIFITIVYCMLWFTWKARNDKVFNNHNKSFTTIAGEIIASSFIWIKHRSKFDCNRVDWDCRPF